MIIPLLKILSFLEVWFARPFLIFFAPYWRYIAKPLWEKFEQSVLLSNILSGLVVILVAAYLVRRLFFAPKIVLDITCKKNKKDQTFLIQLGIKNNKHFLTIESREIFVEIFIPDLALRSFKKIQQNGNDGWEGISIKDCEKIIIENTLYMSANGA